MAKAITYLLITPSNFITAAEAPLNKLIQIKMPQTMIMKSEFYIFIGGISFMNLTTLPSFPIAPIQILGYQLEIWMLKVKNRSVFDQLLYHVPLKNRQEAKSYNGQH